MNDRYLIETISTLRSAEKRLDKMKTKGSPDANILSYELSVLRQRLEQQTNYESIYKP